MVRASIDLGTNTCLLLVAELDSAQQRVIQVLADFANVVRLGQAVDQHRRLHPDAMQRTLQCLNEYSAQVRRFGLDPSQVICVATSQARDAQNSEEFFTQVKQQTGFQFQVISGELEAQATFLGSLIPPMSPRSSVVLDIGGGSTELISVHGSQSIDMGSVRFTERFLLSDPVTDQEFSSCLQAIDHSMGGFSELKGSLPSDATLVAVAGTATTLASQFLKLEKFDVKKVDALRLTRQDIDQMIEVLRSKSIAQRKVLPGMEPLRADVILAGAMILSRVLAFLNLPHCVISTRGLRFGVLIEPTLKNSRG